MTPQKYWIEKDNKMFKTDDEAIALKIFYNEDSNCSDIFAALIEGYCFGR